MKMIVWTKILMWGQPPPAVRRAKLDVLFVTGQAPKCEQYLGKLPNAGSNVEERRFSAA
jgi:hypothetical protein